MEAGEVAEEPDLPTREGYNFDGWYADAVFSSRYLFETAVTADITVYAKWSSIQEKESLYLDSNLYVSMPEDGSVVSDPSTGLDFVNNEMIVYAEIGTEKEALATLIASHEGEIVGEFADVDIYQVRFSNAHTRTELEALQTELERRDLIADTSINTVSQSSVDFYPTTDTEWSDEWGNQFPLGSNWGVEAIHAPEAWEYRDKMSYVNVGVLDNYFYNHNDLIYQKLYFNNVVPEKSPNHGTHVSGTIAAGFDNGIGITGVAPYVNLYGCSFTGISDLSAPLSSRMIATVKLLHDEQCKVLNYSGGVIDVDSGIKYSLLSAQGTQSAKQSQKELEDKGDGLKLCLQRLLQVGDDFVICVAAGNENNKPYTNSEGEETTGNVDARYASEFTVISDKDIQDRIIVVGACRNVGGGRYAYSDFSNVGDRVDVVAPGEDIMSTIDGNNYDKMSGTSMASPHVAGIAAMLFSIDPTLTGEQVKDIIVETAQTRVSGCPYNMVDASAAIEDALGLWYISGKVVGSGKVPLENVTVSLNCIYGSGGEDFAASTQTAEDGSFSIAIPKGITGLANLLFAKEGYKDYKLPLNQYGIDSSVNVGTIQLRTESAFGSISGIVTDSSTGNAIENAEVSFYNGSTLASTYRTTSGGSFYAPLTAGTYTMKVNKEGYGESSTSVTIVAGESKNMNISLTPTAPTVPGDAIHISTPEQFNNIRNDLDAYYILDNDIDLSGYSTWAPIGTTDTPFNGTLDGNGKAITGFRVSSFDMTGESADSSRYYQGVGLFGTVDGGGSIQNLSIENANLNCSWGNGIECYGVLAGKLLEGSISSCSVIGTAINSGTVTSDDATSIHGKDMNSIQEVENWYNNR